MVQGRPMHIDQQVSSAAHAQLLRRQQLVSFKRGSTGESRKHTKLLDGEVV